MKKEKDDKRFVERFLGNMPILGNFLKELAKTETFKHKIEETNKQIEDNLKKGHKKEWNIETDVSIRPIIKEVKKDVSKIVLKKNYFYGKKGNKLILGVKVPKKDVDLSIEGKHLLISSGNFKKKISLPEHFKSIKKKQFKKGVLTLELSK